MLDSLQSEMWMSLQKWWSLFGRYWLVVNRHNDDDVKLMSWLMNGANHGTIDVVKTLAACDPCMIVDVEFGY